MGQAASKPDEERRVDRAPAITGAAVAAKRLPKLPSNVVKVVEQDYGTIEKALDKLLLFSKLEADVRRSIVSQMYERAIGPGEILIKEGDTGLAASELYVVKSGEFEVLEMRQGVNFRVNTKSPGDCFGEISLMYSCPRSATVAATIESVVWVLERDAFRYYVSEGQQSERNQIELFLNSVPLLTSLTREEKLLLVEAMEPQKFAAGTRVINQGDKGDLFYIIKSGEAAVYQQTIHGSRKVNHLFKADFFGERALLSDEPRVASVEAITRLVCLTLNRETFTSILGPLETLMAREKSAQAIQQRLHKLQTKGVPSRVPAEVLLKRAKKGKDGGEMWEVVRARGHADEVGELTKGGEGPGNSLVLTEGRVLGGGAFSRVSVVTESNTQRQYALKRMRKSAVVQCPEHVFCEQSITRNTAHPFCIRQYASFQDKYHLYFLFDLMTGGDLMDVLVAEARVIKLRVSKGLQHMCMAPKVKMLQGMREHLARFYTAQIVLALEYLHSNNIIYRDLKPENVFIDQHGYIKLGDFGFAKVIGAGSRTYTFCGTPGYVAPENVLAQGYNESVDWWGLGVLLYVLLTGRQPFSSPKTDDPMVIMRRIVDDNFTVKYPPYLSPMAKDLVSRLLERRPMRRLGMLKGRADDIKQHRWFEGLDWDLLQLRRIDASRQPKNDQEKRLKELAEAERKGETKQPKETPDELRECEAVFAEF